MEVWLLPLHMTLVGMLVLIFVWRVFYIWQGRVVPYRWLKRGLPDVIDTGVLFSGVVLALFFGIAPWVDLWFAVKLLAVVVYIAAGFLCFSTSQPYIPRRLAVCLSLCMLLYIIALVTTKKMLLGLV